MEFKRFTGYSLRSRKNDNNNDSSKSERYVTETDDSETDSDSDSPKVHVKKKCHDSQLCEHKFSEKDQCTHTLFS